MIKRLSPLLAGALGLAMAMPVAAQDVADVVDVTADTVVATVGETEITIGHMIAMSMNLTENQRQLPPEAIFAGVLEHLIRQEAVSQTRSGLSIYGELHLENQRRSLLAEEAVGEMAESVTVSSEEIEDAYGKRYADRSPSKEFNASHILLETEEDAREVLGELEAGADFAELARERSTGPSGPNGGDLGWFGPGRMVPEFENAVAALDKGQFSGPVRTQFGWHIVILNDIRENAVPTLDEARQELELELRQQKLAANIRAIVEAAPKDMKDTSAIDPGVLGDTSLIDG